MCKPLTELTRREWDDCLALNFTSVWDGSMAAVEQMEWGSTVNVSSLASYVPLPLSGHYAACKAAVNSLTQTMAHELAPDIRVNAVAPGYVQTELTDVLPDELKQAILAATPLARLGSPADIAAAFAYLGSDDAAFVTGHVLSVDGGLTL